MYVGGAVIVNSPGPACWEWHSVQVSSPGAPVCPGGGPVEYAPTAGTVSELVKNVQTAKRRKHNKHAALILYI